MLKVKNLSFVYPNGFKALKNLSFEVKSGEFLVVIGLSGSGKSTLLRCINRLLEPSEGQIEFLEQDISHIKGQKITELRQQIAMIFQHFNLVERNTVLSNVLNGSLSRTSTLRSLLELYSAGDSKKANEYLDLVGLKEKALNRVANLSGGQKQRVAIARALMQQPKLLLADEPVSSLDPATSHSILDYIKKINEDHGITVICNLHFLSLVRQYAHRVIALKDGELVFSGQPTEINEDWFKKIYGEKAKEVLIR